MKFDWKKYENLKFTEEFNCASFAKLVAEDNGIIYPVNFIDHKDSVKVIQSFIDSKPLFDQINDPEDFDIVYMKENDGRRHVGLFFKPNNIYHLPRSGSPLYQKITSEIKPNIIGYFRLKNKDA